MLSGPKTTEQTQATPGTLDVAVERRRLNRLQALSQLVIAIAVVLVSLYYARLPLIVLLVSILIAFVLAPIVDGLQRIRLPRPFGAFIAILLLIGVLYGITYFSYNRALNFVEDLPRYSGQIKRLLVHVREKAETIQKTTEDVLPGSSDPKRVMKVQPSSSWSDFFARNVGSVTEAALILSFIPFLVYFMLTWQQHVRASTVMLFAEEHRNAAYTTLGLISSMIRSFIVGNVLVGLFIGTISVVVFGVIGLPYFYFLGYISGFLSLVPYLGVLLALLPPLVAGLGRIHSPEFAAIVITVMGLHLIALNVLYPKFLGRRLELNPLAVTLALLFWGWMWGAMGLILAIPITAALKIILDHVERLRPYGTWLGE